MTRCPMSGQLGNTNRQPLCVVPLAATTPGRTNRRASVVICFPRLVGGSTSLLAISDPTDVGLSSALPLAVAFSVLPRLHPPDPPCGEVCPILDRDGAHSFSMFCKVHRTI